MQGPLGKHLGVGELEEAGAEGPGLTTHGEGLVRAAGGLEVSARDHTQVSFRSLSLAAAVCGKQEWHQGDR